MKKEKTKLIYHWALQYITERRFSDDIKMPSENTVSRLWGFSRETVRSAYHTLEEEGFIVRRRGSGTFINKSKALTYDLTDPSAVKKICLMLQGRATSPSDVMIEGMQKVFTQNNTELHIYLTDNKFYNERTLLETTRFQGYSGFIIDGVQSGLVCPNLDCYLELYGRKIPVIFYNNYYRELSYPVVGVDNRRAAELLTRKLLNAGYRNVICFFVYDNIQSIEKFQGMASILNRRQIPFADNSVKWFSSNQILDHSCARTIKQALKKTTKSSAIVCGNYPIYKIVREILKELNLSIPNDRSLVCFDYTETTYKEEDITCTVHRGYDLGVHVAQQLIHMIEDQCISQKQYSYKMSPLLYTGNSIKNLNE